jgi:hypothetical protein
MLSLWVCTILGGAKEQFPQTIKFEPLVKHTLIKRDKTLNSWLQPFNVR